MAAASRPGKVPSWTIEPAAKGVPDESVRTAVSFPVAERFDTTTFDAGHAKAANNINDATVTGGASAPDADTIRFSNFSAATDSEVIYYRLGQGWRTAGTDGDAGNTPIEIGQSMDFQRRGPAGFIKSRGIFTEPPTPSGAALAVQAAPMPAVAIERTVPAAGGVQLEWSAEAGVTYQVQTQTSAENTWVNLGEPVVAQGTKASTICRPSGQGFLRIVQH